MLSGVIAFSLEICAYCSLGDDVVVPVGYTKADTVRADVQAEVIGFLVHLLTPFHYDASIINVITIQVQISSNAKPSACCQALPLFGDFFIFGFPESMQCLWQAFLPDPESDFRYWIRRRPSAPFP